MNLVKFIQSHEQLKQLPFLIVFRTLVILKEMNVLQNVENDADVETEE